MFGLWKATNGGPVRNDKFRVWLYIWVSHMHGEQMVDPSETTNFMFGCNGCPIRWMEEILHHLGWLKPSK